MVVDVLTFVGCFGFFLFVWNLVGIVRGSESFHHCQLLKDTLPLFIRGSVLPLFRET